MSDEMILSQATQQGEELHLDLWYPRNETSPIKSLVIGLMDVRAADSIRVSYDFERDGWKIEQASTFEWAGDDEVCDPDWKEVAFIEAWGREKPEGANHFCPGESGQGEWCNRDMEVPSTCGYCGEPNEALIRLRENA